MPWNLDPRVRSAMISDSLDVVGIRHNAMDVNVSALRPGMRAAGLAATVKFVPDSQYDQKDPYGAGIDFLDTLQVGEIAVIGTGGECCCVAGDLCADSLIVCIAVSSALARARLDADLRAKLN